MKHTAATKRKLSEMRRGDRNPFFGRKHTEEFKAALRDRTRQANAKRTYDINPCTLKPFDDITAAYVAGLVDGEGSILMRRGQPTIVIYNTSRPLMAWLKKRIGGSSHVGHSGGRVPCFYWHVASVRNVFELLRRIRPLLIIKSDRADAVMSALRAKYGARLEEARG